tara:strand:+ start:3233 stop:3379 length:147 start_codon:yes stop_codon:yes gene_type:complete
MTTDLKHVASLKVQHLFSSLFFHGFLLLKLTPLLFAEKSAVSETNEAF